LLNDLSQHAWRTAVRCEGFDDTVARHRRDLESLTNRVGASVKVLTEGDHRTFWSDICNFPLRRDRLVCRATLPRATLVDFIHKFQMGGEPLIVADAAAGTIWFAYPPQRSNAKKFFELETAARSQGGHAMLLSAPAELKQGIEVWGASPSTFSLMRGIKRQFDPNDLLNPGRFIGGL
jgi:glycolate oxidase FAD binding subunit